MTPKYKVAYGVNSEYIMSCLKDVFTAGPLPTYSQNKTHT